MKILATVTLLAAVAWFWRFLKPRPGPVYCDPGAIRRAVSEISILCAQCNRARDIQREEAGLPLTLAPYRTFLTARGECDACGGRQYELAAFAAPAWKARIVRQFKAQHDPAPYSDAPRDEWKEERRV